MTSVLSVYVAITAQSSKARPDRRRVRIMAGQECEFTVSFDPRDESEKQLVREYFERFESEGGFGASDSLTETPKGGLFFRIFEEIFAVCHKHDAGVRRNAVELSVPFP